MKDLIVAMGFVFLGCMIFDMIAGEDMSLRTASGEKMADFLSLYEE